MSGRGKTGIGVVSGEWLTADDVAKELAPRANGNSSIRGRDKLPTLDGEEEGGRPTFDLIKPEDLGKGEALPASSHPERFPTDRPLGGERTLQELDDQVTGESVRLMRCFTALQELSMRVSSRDLPQNKALVANRYFFFAFPAIDPDRKGLIMRTHVVDLADNKDGLEELTLDLYRLTSFKDARNNFISREDRINLIKALTVIYTDFAGDKMEDMAVDYRKVLESLTKFDFIPVDAGPKRSAVLTADALKIFALKLRKICFERGMASKRTASGSLPSDLKKECDETSTKIEDLMARAEADRLIQALTAIGQDIKRMMGMEKVSRNLAVNIIRDILDDGEIFVEDYMATFKLERIEASALLRRVFECRLPVNAMGIEQQYLYLILGEFLINSSNLSEKDMARFVNYLKKRK